MANFKPSQKLTDLIKKREEIKKKQLEKSANIAALNQKQADDLAKKEAELKEITNKYAENPSDDLEAKIAELEREIVYLRAKTKGGEFRRSMVYQTDSAELAEINRQIDEQAKAEYLAYFSEQQERLYKLIGQAKDTYLKSVVELNGCVREVNRNYYDLTGNNSIVAINEPDFFYSAWSYRPLGITDQEIKTAMHFGRIDDKRDYPKG
ncbi:hypothetical protein P9386_04970 [Caldifermentibacillus hisashii]|uniref:hypothetical protein n=1 Tax=Caldifermentibacillus hisashii TaxID=996558 RepID=UPI002E1DA10D|nr:hypothetical protein [Caldifermentibacillus hisashii]